MVFVQHEFGLFKNTETRFLRFLDQIKAPVLVAFHTVLPNPSQELLKTVKSIDKAAAGFVVMTQFSAKVLIKDYGITAEKINVIPHGTHLVEYFNKNMLKQKYAMESRKIIATFGLLSAGKCIETTINALRKIVKKHPEVLFLIIGKTHPSVLKNEGEKYRNTLVAKINALQLQNNVKFINQYLPLPELLDYLQLTDVYLFTSNDRNQAVSGTFSYAISCGCPIISTPIPHALEVLKNDAGIIIDFENSEQLAQQVIKLLDNESLRKSLSANGIHKLAPTAWENSAIAHALLFNKVKQH
jgi:glycosyltransferase involved in cell wall biosynthesis